ncbi:hypothetical protein H310_08149 [Aphanomyces invadans]|uniref:Uncharacterized protein n=1 Tax=Aphanomyces invadans TaxID=157072 RepID=A0A024U0R6_9STRA|nr:hypothetical protein H310_08149 [Aphanomyces invadans]ETV99471.1 hypothetical protein H310_08149 [Aphanomyces invadans]|eukprot:XP_008872027.1 hypothetical protein H310_08149 [Aphanomyces invadans]
MSSSSEEDVPLSQLRAAQVSNQRREVNAKREVQEPPNEAKPATTTPGPKRVIDDSDDEMPLLSMKKVKVKKEVMDIDDKPIKKKTSSSSVKREPKSESPVKLEKRTLATSSNQRKIKNIAYKQQEASEALYDSLKGRLVQELLCRWWYAVDWPPKDTKLEETPELQPLDGFPGSFISVKGDNMGSIVDKRNSSGKPTFTTFFAMPSKDVQDLLVVAYENQIKVLIKHEGEDAPLLKDLKQALKSAQNINADKAERESFKALKGYAELAERLKELRE